MESRAKQTMVIGKQGDFCVGKIKVVTVEGREIGVIRLPNGELRAVRNICPHKGAPVCLGKVGGTWPPCEPGELTFERSNEVLVCPWHGYEFDLVTGAQLYQSRSSRLRMYPVDVKDGDVVLSL